MLKAPMLFFSFSRLAPKVGRAGVTRRGTILAAIPFDWTDKLRVATRPGLNTELQAIICVIGTLQR